MENKIELVCYSNFEGTKEYLEKSEIKKKILDLFDNKNVKRVEIAYKNEPV